MCSRTAASGRCFPTARMLLPKGDLLTQVACSCGACLYSRCFFCLLQVKKHPAGLASSLPLRLQLRPSLVPEKEGKLIFHDSFFFLVACVPETADKTFLRAVLQNEALYTDLQWNGSVVNGASLICCLSFLISEAPETDHH